MQLSRRNCSDTESQKAVVRSTSCTQGWLRTAVQCICGTMAVASFVLIVIMTFYKPDTDQKIPEENKLRCLIIKCSVVCDEAPYYGAHENDIIYSVLEADANCERVYLTLHRPTFANGVLPFNWLERMQTDIVGLAIIGGNLKHIPPRTFSKPFTRRISSIIFEDIIIKTWTADTFAGLSHLRKLFIRNCSIDNIEIDALRAISSTLEGIEITASNYWNPANLTGSAALPQLTTIDFSHNNFQSILGKETFTRIRYCNALFLSSSKITAIGLGAFDYLLNIEVIYLNDNFLVTIPDGLFHTIMSITNPVPRIDLQDNYWHCDCSSQELLLLIQMDMLPVYPKCHSPQNFQGLYFSEFITHCNSNSSRVELLYRNYTSLRARFELEPSLLNMNAVCYTSSVPNENTSLNIISPMSEYKCNPKTFSDFRQLVLIAKNQKNISWQFLNWIYPEYFIKKSVYTMVEISTFKSHEFGLMWFKSSCPYEAYCVSVSPDFLRVYNLDIEEQYTFCPLKMNTGLIEMDKCVAYRLKSIEDDLLTSLTNFTIYVCVALAFLMLGAVCVYGTVRSNPTLLKGSKRLVFVKHKTLDALVLPSKVNLRESVIQNDQCSFNTDVNLKKSQNENNIFTITNVTEGTVRKVVRRNSTESSDPSYISAVQPTELQLLQWRLHHHFDEISITTVDSDLACFSWIQGGNINHGLDEVSDRTYLSLK